MNEGMNESTKTMIGLVIIIIAATLIFGIFKVSQVVSQKASTKIAEMGNMLDEGDYTDLDGMTIKGVEVVNRLKMWAEREVCLTVVTKSGSTSNFNFTDNSLSAESTLKVADTQKKSSGSYINPNGNFECSVERDADDVIVQVIFTQQ